MCRTPSPGTLVVETTFLLRTSMPVLHLDAAISPARTSLRQSRPDAIHRNHRHVTAILLAKIHPTDLCYPAQRERPLVEFRSCLTRGRSPSRGGALQAATVARVKHTFPLASPNLQLLPVSLRSLSRVSPFRLMIKSSRLPLPDLTKVYCVKPHFYETAAEVNIRHRINDSMTSSPSLAARRRAVQKFCCGSPVTHYAAASGKGRSTTSSGLSLLTPHPAHK
jgi:hypothetical protein